MTSPSDPKEGVGPVVARYTLTAEDGNPPPCCAIDSAGVHITVVGGALTFHGPAGYRDTVFTPAGPMSGACVHGVPNGAFVNSRTYTVTLTDSTRYLLLPCDRGAYALIVIRRLDHEGGSSAKPDTIDLADSRSPSSFTASVTAPTVLVTGPAHQYRFDPGN
ncbi:MAG: hypothetical protein AUJ01_12305 [Acidobacteria bacterium 13_1_40CM_3_65_5]|nr:MAG: hypothetical protein AUJ01_12305 [Acidobacteria bacterium 13_1_40CM_3_65_5]